MSRFTKHEESRHLLRRKILGANAVAEYIDKLAELCHCGFVLTYVGIAEVSFRREHPTDYQHRSSEPHEQI